MFRVGFFSSLSTQKWKHGLWNVVCESGGLGSVPSIGQTTNVDLGQVSYLVQQSICDNGLS